MELVLMVNQLWAITKSEVLSVPLDEKEQICAEEKQFMVVEVAFGFRPKRFSSQT